MREIPFDPSDPQAAFRAASARAADPHAGGWHSVGPPGFVAPPQSPATTGSDGPEATAAAAYSDAGGGSRAAWTGSALIADPATTHSTVDDVAGVLMSMATGPRYRYFGFGYGSWSPVSFVAGVISSMFGGSGWMRS